MKINNAIKYSINNSIYENEATTIAHYITTGINNNTPLSIIIAESVDYDHITEQDLRFCHFRDKFISLLGNRMYDLNRRGDCKDISVAMIVAYKDAVDPKIVEKLQHLQNVTNITFNTKFLDDLAYMIKQGLL